MLREEDGTGVTVQVRWKDPRDQDQENVESHEDQDLAVDLVRRGEAGKEDEDHDQLREEEDPDHNLFQLL